jgi:AraC-like DNA-binding protein
MTMSDLIRRASSRATSRYRELVPGLGLAIRSEPSSFEAMVYEPLVCLILQGQKQMVIGGQQVVISTGESIIVSHAVPIVARITEAPYLSLVARIDLSELRSLHEDLGDEPPDDRPARGFAVSAVPEEVLEVFGRYLALADDPDDARVLAPLVRRELHYRLLKADSGGMLRRLLRRDSHASSISRAIHTLRSDYRSRLEIAALALSVGMSPSAFYKHFKAVTSTTPLQYQKDLRLTEARRLLLGGDHTVSTAAYAVGYQSPSQFSREYARKFHTPPRAELPRATSRSAPAAG